MKTKLFFLIFCGLLSVSTYSQELTLARSFGGTGNDVVSSIAVDTEGNIYTAGNFFGTADFDPGLGIYNLSTSSINNSDIFISKIDYLGNLVWAKRIGGWSTDDSKKIVLDSSGNIYITGRFNGTVDFDPNSGIFNMTSSSSSMDVFICKYDNNGNLIWAKKIGGSNHENASSINIDFSGNIYITGGFNGTVDFNPGAGVFNLTSIGSNVATFSCKLDPNGNFIWAKQFTGTGAVEIESFALDLYGNIYSTGYLTGTIDFDPSPTTYNLSTSSINNPDIFICKLDANGNFVWAKKIGGIESDIGFAIALDISGNAYVTGSFGQTVDFDPGVGIYNLQAQQYDIFINKLDINGNFVWAKKIGGSHDNAANSISLDDNNNVYTTGYITTLADFDPDSVGYYSVGTGIGLRIGFISKLDSNGIFLSAKSVRTEGASDIILDEEENLYLLSGFSGSINLTDNTSSLLLNSNGGGDVLILKYVQSGVVGQIYNDINTNCIKDNNDQDLLGSKVIINPGNISVKTNSIGRWFVNSLPINNYSITYDTLNRWKKNCSGIQNFSITNPNNVINIPSLGLNAKFGFTKGLIYNDINNNCIKESGEIGLNSRLGIINPGNIIIQTDTLGLFISDTLNIGNYTITIDTTDNWRLSCPDTINIEVLPYGIMETTHNFGLIYTTPCILSLSSNYSYVDNSNGNYSFSNTSLGSFNQTHWAFGDGTTSTATNPNHTFSANGTYVVVLTVNDSTGSSCMDYYLDTIVVTGVVAPLQCAAGFVMYPDAGGVTVVNSSTGTNLTYLWNFGDGNTSNAQFPTHTYATTGNYYLCLTIDDGAGCVDMYCDSIGENGVVFNKQTGFTINVIAPPLATQVNEQAAITSAMSIYPNPTGKKLNVVFNKSEPYQLKIVTINGKLIETKTIVGNTTLDVNSYASGMYFITATNNEGKVYQSKFVKE